MKKKIGIIPTVIIRRKVINLIIDSKLLIFVKKCFPNSDIEILHGDKIKNKLNLIISSGGNTISSLDKKINNKFREKLDKFYFNIALKNNISFLGICHGAQFIANKYKSKIEKKKRHTNKNHLIKFNSKKKYIVNSYHDFSITKLGKTLEKIAWTNDSSIEAFKIKKKKVLGIMWHPERYKKARKFDQQFINKHL